MAITILGGLAHGRSLFVPKGDLIRPTSVRLKRKIFDSHQNWEGRTIVDLCCGTGAIGLEAWSRGAEHTLLVEQNKKVSTLTRKNIDSLEQSFEGGKIELFQEGASKFLQQFKTQYSSWDDEKRLNTYLFFDPPYELKELYEQVYNFMRKDLDFIGELWIESDRQKGHGLEHWEAKELKPYKSYVQGTSYVTLFDYSVFK